MKINHYVKTKYEFKKLKMKKTQNIKQKNQNWTNKWTSTTEDALSDVMHYFFIFRLDYPFLLLCSWLENMLLD